MHSHASFEVITKVNGGYIGVCKCCSQYNFVYNNILLVFKESELLNFLDWLMDYRYSCDNVVMLYTGRSRVYTSPHSNLFLAFSDDDLDGIATLSAEFKLMLDVNEILLRK